MFSLSQKFKNRPNATYMSDQRHVTHEMRTRLFDWLTAVGEFYALPQEVWFLALNYFDRFLTRVVVKENDVQLLGMTCLYVAWLVY